MTGRSFPLYGYVGLVVMLVSEAGMLLKIQPFFNWHTPIAWTGFILFVDALVWKRRGRSWIRDAPAELVFLATLSVPLWIVFEMYNKYSIHNWHYVGLTESLPLRYLGYIWSFATIWPAIFEAGDLVASLRSSESSAHTADPSRGAPIALGTGLVAALLAGSAMLVVPILFPSRWLAAPVWLGFILLLDPLNARAGDESIVGDLRAGHSDRLVNLLISGLLCGVVWEFWNYWAGTKWVYTVPVPPDIKIFEMPVLGYGGFPAFAVECFAMYVTVRRWLWRRRSYPISL